MQEAGGDEAEAALHTEVEHMLRQGKTYSRAGHQYTSATEKIANAAVAGRPDLQETITPTATDTPESKVKKAKRMRRLEDAMAMTGVITNSLAASETQSRVRR